MSIGAGGIDESELNKLFHIDQENLGARSVPLAVVDTVRKIAIQSMH